MQNSKLRYSEPASSAGFIWKEFAGWATLSSMPSVNRRSTRPNARRRIRRQRTEADYHRILEDPAVEAVHICAPNALHFPIAKDALQRANT